MSATKNITLNWYSSMKKEIEKDSDNFWHRKLTLKVRILPFLTTFTQLTARQRNFLRGRLLVLGLKECLVECETLCVKSEVMLNYFYQAPWLDISWPKSINTYVIVKSFSVTIYSDKGHARVSRQSLKPFHHHLTFAFLKDVHICFSLKRWKI